MANETETNNDNALQNLTAQEGTPNIQQEENAMTVAAPITAAPEPATPAEPASGAEESPTEGSDNSTEPEPEGSTKRPPWFQRRIDQLTAEKWEERRKNEQLEQQTAALLAQLAETRKAAGATTEQSTAATTTPTPATPATPDGKMVVSQAELDALATRRAAEIAAQNNFNATCQKVYDSGKDEYSDFDDSLKTFKMLGGITPDFLNTVIEMPEAHKVLYALSKNPEKAERILKLPPVKMAVELTRFESTISAPKRTAVSRAPAPITPVDGGSRSTEDPESMGMDAWVQWREKQIAAQRGH